MSKIDDGGAAFPLHPGINPDWDASAGMSLRDAAALAALPAVISAASAGQHNPERRAEETMAQALARNAFELADAFIAARKEPAQ